MTREEADELQKVIDEYIAIRDKGSDECSLGDKKFRAAPILKIQLATYLEPLLPEVKLTEDGMDMMAMLGPIMSIFGAKSDRADLSPVTMTVVEPCPEFDSDTMDHDEYDRLYSIRIPRDLMDEVLHMRSSKTMFDLMSKREKKE